MTEAQRALYARCRARVRRATIRSPAMSQLYEAHRCRELPTRTGSQLWMKATAGRSCSWLSGCGSTTAYPAIDVHAPDRLARRYAHQVLVQKSFLNARSAAQRRRSCSRSKGDAEMSGPRSWSVEARSPSRRTAGLSGTDGRSFGYHYVSRSEGGGVARFEVVEDEARIVGSSRMDRPG